MSTRSALSRRPYLAEARRMDSFTDGHQRNGLTHHANGKNGRTPLAEPEQRLELKRGGFIASYPPFESLRPGSPEAIWEPERLGLYVHLPYCRKRCTFCF